MPVNDLILLRKGSSSEWNSTNPVLASGEPGFDTTNNILKVGDGSSNWNNLSNISASPEIYKYENTFNFPSSGNTEYIYISTDSSRLYRWTGNEYMEIGSIGNSVGIIDSQFRSLFVPSAPSSLTASAGDTQATLSWTAPSVLSQTPITDYNIQYSSNNGTSWNDFARESSTSTTVIVTGLTNGTSYIFRVRAVNGAGSGNYSTSSSSITPSFNPSSIAGLQLWLDASDSATLFDATSGGSLVAADGTVARWEDKSGNARHTTQAEQSRRPLRRVSAISSNDAIEFDGSNDAMMLNQTLFSGKTSVSWFAVIRNDDSGNNNRAAFGERVAFNDANFSLLKVGTSSILYSRGAADGATSVTISESVSFPTSAMLASVVTTANSGTARRNQQIAGTNSTTTANITYKSLFLVGNFPADDADFSVVWWDGLICEIVIYDSALSDTDREAVEDYLIDKWGIS